jgi:hypothetical protein
MDDVLPDALPTRRRAVAPPLRTWLFTAAVFTAITYAFFAYLIFVNTPLVADDDPARFTTQIEALDQQAESYRAAGQDPLRVMFIGTSRLKNVVLDSDVVAAAAKDAGITRPVASSYLAVNWGGFQRLEHAVKALIKAHPDDVVIMPELYYEDYSLSGRFMIAYLYIQQRFWLRTFRVFDEEAEFKMPTCDGFDIPADSRLREHRTWIRKKIDAPGPRAAGSATKALADAGIRVWIADVPTTTELADLQSPRPAIDSLLQFHDLDGLANVKPLVGFADIPRDDYCDYAHIRPDRARAWLDPLFQEIGKHAADWAPAVDPSSNSL